MLSVSVSFDVKTMAEYDGYRQSAGCESFCLFALVSWDSDGCAVKLC